MVTDKASSVAFRFWVLLTIILVATIVCATITLRFAALPYLEDYQARVLDSRIERSAEKIDAILAGHGLLTDLIAKDPDVINLVIGYSNQTEYFTDFLDTLPLSKDLSWVLLFDAFGDVVLDYDLEDDDLGKFDPGALDTLVAQTLDGQVGERRSVVLASAGEFTYLVTATAIRQYGFVEGVLLTGYRLNLGQLLPNDVIMTDARLVHDAFISDISEVESVEQLSHYEISLVIAPDRAALVATGNRMIFTGTLSVASVLVLAFGIFAFLSKSVIISPHRKLHDQAKRLEDQKRHLAELAAISERANDAVLVTDLKGNITWANPAFEALSGHRLQDVIGKKPGSFLQSEKTDPQTIGRLHDHIAGRRAVKVEIENRKRDGTDYWISLSISLLTTDLGKPYGFVAISSDVTEARQSREALLAAKKEIEHQSFHDPLTGLPNRRALEQELSKRIAANDTSTTLIRIDLDHFKYVNDTMGHEAGDYVLCRVADILDKETKDDDLAVRVGGDEFVLLLSQGSTEAAAFTIAERILSRISLPLYFDSKTIRVGSSFGIASLNSDIVSHEGLLVAADAALYEAKEAGRNRVHLYTPELNREVMLRRDLARELRLGIARQEFEPFFQPQVDAATGALSGVEVLARWRSDALGLVMPDQFLPLARQLSVVEEIDDLIFQKAVAQVLELKDLRINVPKVSFNVTAQRIEDQTIVGRIKSLDHEAPQIALEVLESVLVEEQSHRFEAGMDALRNHGASIEIDDFGSGHASIIGLMQLRPNAMKIDRKLVQPIVDDPLTRGMLERIVSMAELMELSVIAEGVETEAHAVMLQQIGCHHLQGFFFGRPMPIDDFTSWCLSSRADEYELWKPSPFVA